MLIREASTAGFNDTARDGAVFPCALPTGSLFLADLLLRGGKGLELSRMLVSSPRELLKLARQEPVVHMVIYELRNLHSSGLEGGLQKVVELGSLPDGSVEYALASGERYLAWAGANPVAIDFVLRPLEGDAEDPLANSGPHRLAKSSEEQ